MSWIDWTKADWTKTNREIAAALGCTYASVAQKRHQLKKPKVYERIRMPVEIAQPIDYEALAKAYVAARWKCTGPGFPQPDQIELLVLDLQRYVLPGPQSQTDSGGIYVRRVDDKLVVLISPKLAETYLPLTQKPVSA